MPIALIVGPAVALLGIVAVVFVMRHKSVEKHSMYSARRSQIEHKVRAARQRTLAPHGREEKPAPPAGAGAMPPPPPTFDAGAPVPTFTYEAPAYQAPAYPPPSAPPIPAFPGQEATDSTPWEVGPAEPASPSAPPAPAPDYQYPPTEPEPAYAASPPSTEQAWTPAPTPSEPLPPAEPVLTTTPAGAGAEWSIVGEAATSSGAPPAGKKKSKREKAAHTDSWQLASGNAPGAEGADDEVKKPSSTVAIAQYAVLVVGLVMVLIGVLVMVANSHPA